MSSRPDPLDSDSVDDPRASELMENAESGWYGDSAFFGAMAHCPEILTAIGDVFESFGQGEHVDPSLLELMRLKVAESHQCAYCATVRTLEVREDVAPKEDAVFGEVDPEGLSRREYLAISLAADLSTDPHRISDQFFGDLREEFSEAEIVELLLFGSLEVGLDRFCIALELQTTDDSAYPDDLEYPLENPRPKTT
ncbi:carboxymuconolactone decarboxylase family protein [Natrarchaeobius halalkaliphilus]|uniref:Carboxymuconolactone decarboxylase family protein n=1 Tax=Natrarchaeobius halalkaliphilus TaxID=1679091 RepID=A0A3N6M3T3_9EURY|nr:carboxymuconolactone decarboxylase family protein [Natrarchaeobius halalkaliphilus]RQG86787.1 carboxymuconolactone decarboxylase family protein [Natrarchaeobius halalkaliphilus]